MPSTSGAIADAFVTAIGALALAGDPEVRKRKRLIFADGDPATVILVAQGDGEEIEPLADFGNGLAFLNAYPVSVAIASRNAGKIAENETVRAWKEAIRDRFREPGDLAGINDIRPGVKSAFDATGVQKQAIDWVELDFRVQVIE